MIARIGCFLSLACALGCAPAKPSTTTTGNVPLVPILADAAPTCSTAKAKEGEDTIVRVELLGNRSTPTNEICAYLRTRAGQAFDETRIATDVRELFYSGYMDDVVVTSRIADEGRVVTFTMRERPIVKEFIANVPAAASPSAEHLQELFGKAGGIFSGALLRIGEARLREEYVALGYRSADVGHVVTPAPDNQVVVTLTVVPGLKQLVTSIRFVGAKQVKESELLSIVETEQGTVNAVGGVYRQDLFEHSLLLVNARYFDRGMITVKVGEPELTSSADKTGLAIVVPIEEGPIFKIGALSCVGDLAGTEAECLLLLDVKKGEVFSRAKLLDGISRIRDFQTLKGRGTMVEPTTNLDLEKKLVDLKLTISK